MLKEVGINHVLTSPYNSKSNGGCDRSVRSLKGCLRRDKVKKIRQQKIDELTYLLNQHPQEDTGTAAERFFGRSLRSCLPNSLTRFVDHTKLIENRKASRWSWLSRRGGLPRRPGDKIVIQDVLSLSGTRLSCFNVKTNCVMSR